MHQVETQIHPPSHATELVVNPNELFTFTDLVARDHYADLSSLWSEEAERLHALPEQQPEVIDEGRGLHFGEISLYHGGPVRDIQQFEMAEDYTIGKGFYATSTPDQAFGYALVRARPRQTSGDNVVATEKPTVYEATAADISFIDLRQQENVQPILTEFADYLEKWVEAQKTLATMDVYVRDGYMQTVREKIDLMRRGEVDGQALSSGNLKEVLHQTGSQFKEFVVGLGYDGIIAFEGGEGGQTSAHDSWVIMNPDKVEVTKELSFAHPDVRDTAAKQQNDDEAKKLFGSISIPPAA